MFANITTKYGLASLHTTHPRANTHYDYRGNIHSYFNFKILYWAKKVLAKNPRDDGKDMKLLNSVILDIRAHILQFWKEGKSFTMWSP